VNDGPGQTPTDDESPEVADVRRLLADARHTDPMPDDVAARMDRVLDRLGDQPAGVRPEPADADVTLLVDRRRRRAVQLLVAAAAVVVAGVVFSQHTGSSGGGATAGSQVQAESNAGGQAAPSEQPGADAQRSAGPNQDAPQPGTPPRVRDGRLVVRSQHFSDDALHGRTLLERADPAAKAAQYSLLQDCRTQEMSGGKVLAAEYRNAPAALLFRRPQGGTQVVDLYVCGSSTPIRTTTLPAP
jgi:hypothetical protein